MLHVACFLKSYFYSCLKTEFNDEHILLPERLSAHVRVFKDSVRNRLRSVPLAFLKWAVSVAIGCARAGIIYRLLVGLRHAQSCGDDMRKASAHRQWNAAETERNRSNTMAINTGRQASTSHSMPSALQVKLNSAVI